ncbi:phosphate ABC transporter substrate-binding protein, PhoT family [Haladaptatus litoreus]|uniref:Phosphate ABC transporter substrate-binding protein, PhoT family n=1 Tax=Haladaptatus litoreus TaxID=553468 RepID=A0A1N6ZR57_9EURY|nr:PstS family phosphate ABC transporter substrate-binding protein [Haladaptatus litoreus]SIR29372.1 phosphate ABC transporter substrate-binding protein, PhoT family [Haladaptatus litoreus]
MSDKSSSGVSRRKFLMGAGASGAIALAGCTKNPAAGGGSGGSGGGDGGGLSGSISISGSSTVFPLAQAIQEEFNKEYEDVGINIKSTGSGGGFANHFCPGKSDFNNASRPIQEEEVTSCENNDVTPVELQVATDALTVVVNNNNDFVDCMTVDELKQIWQGGNDKVTNWSDVNSDWPDEKIQLYGPTEASGTLDYMHEAVVGEDNEHRMDHQASENDNSIISGVKESKYALGYLGFSYYSKSKDEVKALGIDNGNGCVKPSLETAKSGEYKPLSRPLFTYPAQSALSEDHIAEFAKFWVEQTTNQEIVADSVGYVPLDDSQKEEQMNALEEAIEKANGN